MPSSILSATGDDWHPVRRVAYRQQKFPELPDYLLPVCAPRPAAGRGAGNDEIPNYPGKSEG